MISKVIAEEKIQQVRKLIEKNDKIVILTHLSPDGDAIGSTLGLFHFLNELDKQVSVIIPNDMPQFLKWMDGAKDIVVYEKYPEFAEELMADADLVFCLDFNARKRADCIEPALVKSKARKVMVDHHPYPEDFCDVTISYPQICSTGELVFRLICRMGEFELINHACAEAIYVAMMTDTGAFTYNSESPEIYTIIAALINKGVKKDLVYQKIFHTNSVDRMKLMGFALSEKLRIYPEYQTAVITLSKEELKRFNHQSGDTEGFVNMPLSISGIRCSVFFREDDQKIKISFRSKGSFAVNRIASDYFSGGGHTNAAGGEFYGTINEAVALFEKVIPRYVATAVPQ
ncbi:DHH family phosphoesterase [Parabacteroides sp. FAFU027]|uniref:DHH family phosphoesterase n=1 Tax=Parabacteroides sp. FAFU027 TaxID=2922715 RepID=UPI001FAF5E59|nr:bifunctional oligoribonuclease/PAP phosphatase NrnA [Parabacteroides sp. FAFU027]